MLAALLTNLAPVAPNIPVIDHTHDGPPPWIRNKEQIDHLKRKAEQMQAQAAPEIVEQLEELIEPYKYEVGPEPFIDWQGILEQMEAMRQMEALYALFIQEYNAMILADDEAFLEALAASGEML